MLGPALCFEGGVLAEHARWGGVKCLWACDMSLVEHRMLRYCLLTWVGFRMVDGLTAHDVLCLASHDDFELLLAMSVNSRSSSKLVLAYGA